MFKIVLFFPPFDIPNILAWIKQIVPELCEWCEGRPIHLIECGLFLRICQQKQPSEHVWKKLIAVYKKQMDNHYF